MNQQMSSTHQSSSSTVTPGGYKSVSESYQVKQYKYEQQVQGFQRDMKPLGQQSLIQNFNEFQIPIQKPFGQSPQQQPNEASVNLQSQQQFQKPQQIGSGFPQAQPQTQFQTHPPGQTQSYNIPSQSQGKLQNQPQGQFYGSQPQPQGKFLPQTQGQTQFPIYPSEQFQGFNIPVQSEGRPQNLPQGNFQPQGQTQFHNYPPGQPQSNFQGQSQGRLQSQPQGQFARGQPQGNFLPEFQPQSQHISYPPGQQQKSTLPDDQLQQKQFQGRWNQQDQTQPGQLQGSKPAHSSQQVQNVHPQNTIQEGVPPSKSRPFQLGAQRSKQTPQDVEVTSEWPPKNESGLNLTTTYPSGFKLREEAPMDHSEGTQVVPSQPAFKITQPLKVSGDEKWPPRKSHEGATQEKVREFIKPKKGSRDYTEFFAQNALPSTYPAYRAPPGTQHHSGTEEAFE